MNSDSAEVELDASRRRLDVELVIFCVMGIGLVLATTANLLDAELFWVNLFWLASATAAFRLAWVGLKIPTENYRPLRVSFAQGLGLYLIGQILWFAQVLLNVDVVPGPSDLFFLAAPVPILWRAFQIAKVLSVLTANTITCDAVSLSLATTVVIISLFGEHAAQWSVADAVVSMAYPVVYLAPVGAFLVIILAQPYKESLTGIWMAFSGSVILGVSFTVWVYQALVTEPEVGTFVDFMFGVGLILVGYGSAILHARPETHFPRERRKSIVSDVLPTLAILAAVFAVLTTEVQRSYEAASWIFLFALLLVNGYRQLSLVTAQDQARRHLSALTTRLESAQEEERRNLALYLHDNVAQGIAVLRIKFGIAEESRTGRNPADLTHQVDNVFDELISDIRAKTFELSPPSLDVSGLAAGLEALIGELNKSYPVTFTMSDNCAEVPVCGADARFLFRICKELLTNVVKHANAAAAEVVVDRRGGNLLIVVADNGDGLDEQRLGTVINDSFGLYSIRESALSLGGDFQIRSTIGAGTTVEVSIPDTGLAA